MPEEFRCLLVHSADATGAAKTAASGGNAPTGDVPGRGTPRTAAEIVRLPASRLPAGEVLLRVGYSALNYKDALAYQGHPGVVKHLPHVPGIDAAGTVLASSDPRLSVGQEVIVTGYELGQSVWGGWSELIRVPAAWVIPLPEGLSLREAMIYGTAGFTAAQSVMALQRNDVAADSGEVVVTGATGGVGSLAVRLLAHLGYRVVAVTGKRDQHAELLQLGAHRVLSRDEVCDASERPLLSARWAGAVDTVGGELLNGLLRATHYGGCVTACGLVAGPQLDLTVYPFLLRGISLCGVASADCPAGKRHKIWDLLAGQWKLPNLSQWVTEVGLEELPGQVERISRGQVVGRVIVGL